MKKTLWMTGAMMCAMAMFTACSDNDDNTGNGKGPDDGGTGVEVKEKKLVRVEEDGKYVTLFAYDEEGRLSKITDTDKEGSYEDVQTVAYSDGRVTVRGEYDEDIYVLNADGYLTELMYGDEEEDATSREDYTYEYKDGYLVKASYTYEHLVDGEWVLGGFEEEEYTVKDGDLVSLVFRFSEDGETVKGGEEITVEPSSTPNNMNIDYLYNLWLGTEDEVLLCLSGKRFKHLPAKIVDTEKEVTTFEYTVDKDGYVTKAVEKDDEDTYVYTFFYE